MDTEFLLKGYTGKIEGHLETTDKTVQAFTNLYSTITPKKIFEVGFNAGHSAYMSLSLLPEVSLHSIDIGRWLYTKPNVEKLSDIFGNRFSYKKTDSKKLTPADIAGYDVIYLDGDHSRRGLAHDLELANSAQIKYILVDDYSTDIIPHIKLEVDMYLTFDNFPYILKDVYEYDSSGGETQIAVLQRI